MYLKVLILNILSIRNCLWNQLQNLCHSIFAIIPESPAFPSPSGKPTFVRDRKLSFKNTIATILSIVNSGKNRGLDGKIDDLITRANQNQLWPASVRFDRSSIYKARKNIDWKEFESILHAAASVAKKRWKNKAQETWCGMSVFAMDGSLYTLPATDAMRKEFDPRSGLHNAGKGHYPQCLVETAYDVFSHLPVARVVLPCKSSERDAAKQLLPFIPSGNVTMFDRGYPGFDFINNLRDNYDGYFLIRSSATGTFKEIIVFVDSGKDDVIVTIKPNSGYLSKLSSEQAAQCQPLTVRLIRLKSPDGTISVLITNMLNKTKFCLASIKNLYYDRYRIEEYFRHEKCVIEIEHFHTKDPNGIRQELLAAAIVSIIARLMVNITTNQHQAGRPQFKNAVLTLALDAALLTASCIGVATIYFNKLLGRIARIKYYKPKKKRRPYPRVTMGNPNKWIRDRKQVLLCQP